MASLLMMRRRLVVARVHCVVAVVAHSRARRDRQGHRRHRHGRLRSAAGAAASRRVVTW